MTAVTIAIPFYNAEKYLSDSIRSVFAQTHQNWELILIDDGSSDRSLEIARSIRDPRVRVVSDGKNKKLAARLNEITKLAKYDYIARMDADDLMCPTRLEVQLKFLLDNPQFDLVSAGTYSILNNGDLIGVRGSSGENPTVSDLIYRRFNIVHAAVLARKSWLERNLYDESLQQAQDSDLWIRTSLRDDFKIKNLSNVLYIYREENNVTKEKLLNAYKIASKIKAKHIRSPFRRLLYTISLFAKSCTVQVLSTLGYLGHLQKRRNLNQVPVSDIKNYRNILETIRSVDIEGLHDKH